MVLEKIILIGAGGHAGVVLDIINELGRYQILGVIDESSGAAETLGLPWLGNDSALPALLAEGVTTVAMGIGGFRDNKLRKRIFTMVKGLGFRVATLIHPSAILASSVTVGEGSVIFAGVVINPRVRLGDNVIVATRSSVDHDTVVEDHVLISAGVSAGAQLHVAEEALIAIGACVVSNVKIGRRSVVGAGCVVIRDVAEEVLVVGNPARVVRTTT